MSIDLNQYDYNDDDGEWEPPPLAGTVIRILASFFLFSVGVLTIILFLMEKM